jgi:SOUL heme-binding protein
MRLPVLLSGFLLAACSVIGARSATEEPRYEILTRSGPLEIRRYGPRLAAETTVAAASETAARNEGFRRLAGYIFGGNRGTTRVAMTMPVAQSGARIAMAAPVATATDSTGRWHIRFFMPASQTLDSLPIPNDPAVRLIEVPGETLAVLRYSGVPGAAATAQQRAALLALLSDSTWQPTGLPFDWFYDPPWTLPPLRRNEAVVTVAPR